ncbi:protein SIEVE ELEMENT OCCLUSION A-like [Macadamia integrifolia]|uniref:protein SIEVE ELEMENT OCCLUSION A-like n=1 Tax=Macadamia integrifolia TaxID=60698 RepID=UPI001C4FB38D|nr:protein SIEVE ELEMENT OCCLUSION A-like [Macadamia integrifolia]
MDHLLKLIWEEHRIFTDEYDKKMTATITEAPNCQVVEVEPILKFVKDILKLSTTITAAKDGSSAPVVAQAMESLKLKTTKPDFESLAKTIHEISCKISSKCSGGEEENNIMTILIQKLSNYTWDAKIVLVMAAFAVNFGGFFSLIGAKNKPKPLETLWSLIEAMVNETECVVNFKRFHPEENSLGQSSVVQLLQTAVYLIFRSVLTCVPHFFGFLVMSHEYTPSKTEEEELSKLLKKLNDSYDQLDRHRKEVYEKKIAREYQELVELFEKTQTDNIEILNKLINPKDGLKPLIQVSTQLQVDAEAVGKKNVLLVISTEFDVKKEKEELGILIDLCNNTKQVSEYELVFLPLRKTTGSKAEELKKMLDDKKMVDEKKMKWHLVHHDHQINRGAVKYIKEVWHFNNKPILVVLNTQGKVINQNAFNNIRICGAMDLSIVLKTEAQLWAEATAAATTWGPELLLQTIDEGKKILQWMNKDKERYVFLYGGEDISWIMEFKTGMEEKATDIDYEMIYIGARNITKRVKDNITFIKEKKLSNCLTVEDVSKFWLRLESIWNSKMQGITKSSIEEDEIMKGIKSMLTYDGSMEKGWGMITKGSTVMVKAEGNIILTSLKQSDSLKESSTLKGGFMEVVIDNVKKQESVSKSHCNQIILPVTAGKIPEDMPCEKCHSTMEKYVLYKCCKEY